MKKEVWKDVETWEESGEELRSFEKYGKEHQGPKKGPKKFSKILNFENVEIFRNSLVPRRCWYIYYIFLAEKSSRAQREVNTQEADAGVTLRD